MTLPMLALDFSIPRDQEHQGPTSRNTGCDIAASVPLLTSDLIPLQLQYFYFQALSISCGQSLRNSKDLGPATKYNFF